MNFKKNVNDFIKKKNKKVRGMRVSFLYRTSYSYVSLKMKHFSFWVVTLKIKYFLKWKQQSMYFFIPLTLLTPH